MIRSLVKCLPKDFRDRHRPRVYLWLAYLKWWARKLSGRIAYPPQYPQKAWLHLGCGSLDVPGFINVDARPFRHIHHLGTVERIPYIEDEALDLVYVSHCLEHVSYRDVPTVLAEWRRTLKQGGVLRIAVPDLDVISDVFRRSGGQIEVIEPYLLGGQDYPQNVHLAAFNQRYLTRLMEEAGFTGVRQWDAEDATYGVIDDCSTAYIPWDGEKVPVSLNLEAVRA